ncbi:hypothetical protein BDZ97DRAFT_355518 [Flammula alnicola]|nr:hypothetical protein BDZ97DRAFT_355518 [Flammula alnicola]
MAQFEISRDVFPQANCPYGRLQTYAYEGDIKAVLEALPKLPLELYRAIVENIEDRTTLLSLCLASNAFKFEAERLLYKSVTSTDTTNRAAHLAFLRTITENGRLALLVHTYHFPFIDNDTYDPLNQLLRRALQATTNLRELTITGLCRLAKTYYDGLTPQSLFSGCTFQLETLYLVQYVDAREFFSFLATQQRLRRLAVYFDRNGQSPPSTVCPKLDFLQGNRRAIEVLLPNRQITTLVWDPSCYEATRAMPHLSEPLRYVKTLMFDGCYLRPSLSAIVDHLASLEYLELVALHAEELDDVCKISSLRGLVLTDAFSFSTWDRRVSMISPIFASCGHLDHVDIEQVQYGDYQRLYQRWTLPHGSEVPVLIGLFRKEVVRRRFYND